MSEAKVYLSMALLRRTIRFDRNGKRVSDTITDYVNGVTYPTPKRKKKFKKEKVVFT